MWRPYTFTRGHISSAPPIFIPRVIYSDPLTFDRVRTTNERLVDRSVTRLDGHRVTFVHKRARAQHSLRCILSICARYAIESQPRHPIRFQFSGPFHLLERHLVSRRSRVRILCIIRVTRCWTPPSSISRYYSIIFVYQTQLFLQDQNFVGEIGGLLIYSRELTYRVRNSRNIGVQLHVKRASER
ncbi:uncharacterized protein LOC143188729 [Calliopsis andreniformis]|uniref:uncharacterized protein LOC143188729 n=1 Tax=Calliopsis andreniformis TaxID=337506 RepID=UPI003FCD57E0